MQTNKFGIICSQNVSFVTMISLTRTEVMYPQLQDFFSVNFIKNTD